MKITYKSLCMFVLLIFSTSLLAITYNKLPRDIDELIERSDLIVIGTLGETVDKRLFYGYQDGADKLAQQEQETPFTLGLPLVDYAIHVQEVIMDDKEFPLADTNSRRVVFRTFEDEDEASSAAAVKDRRGRMVFFLTRNPDNETYGIISSLHRIKLGDGDDEISYSFELRDHEVPFAPKAKSKDFMNDVKKNLKSKKKGL